MGLLERIDARPHDAPLPTEYLLDEAAECIVALESALTGLVDHYTALINSGDAGNWDPETDAPVIAARHALALSKGSEG